MKRPKIELAPRIVVGIIFSARLIASYDAVAQDERATVDSVDNILLASPEYKPPQYLVDKMLEHDPQISKLQEQLQLLQQGLNQAIASVKTPDNDPTVRALRTQIEQIQKQVDGRRNNLLPKIVEQLKQAGPNVQTDAGQLELPNLDELLAKAMENNPDLVAAKAKLALAEAELNSKRMEVARAITALVNDLEVQEKVIEVCKYELELDQQAAKAGPGAVTQSELRQKETTLLLEKAKLDREKSDLRLLFGEVSTVTKTSTSNFSSAAQMPRGPLVDKIKAALDQPTAIETEDSPTPFSNILDALAVRHKIPIHTHFTSPDPSASKIAINIGGVPMRYALEALEDRLDGQVKFVVRDYGIVAVNREAAAKNGFVSAVTFGLTNDQRNRPTDSKPSTKSDPPSNAEQKIDDDVKKAKEYRTKSPTFSTPEPRGK